MLQQPSGASIKQARFSQFSRFNKGERGEFVLKNWKGSRIDGNESPGLPIFALILSFSGSTLGLS